jgi:hypothetical protein
MSRYRILSFDGGGIRGLLSLILLERLERAVPGWIDRADLLAGTSTGGVVANNPSMAALALTQDHRAFGPRPPPHDRLRLFSLGTGQSLVRIEGDRLDWGYSQWTRPLIDLMLDGVAGVADYQCRQILGRGYFRLAPVFPAGTAFPMDAVRRIPELVAFAGSVDLADAVRWLRREWCPTPRPRQRGASIP